MSTETRTKDQLLRASEARLQVMKHPTRRAALMAYRDKGPIAPVEVALEVRRPISEVSYHSRELLKYGFIELVRTEPVRGATKSYYVATERHIVEKEEWEAIDPMLKEGVLLDGVKPMLEDFARAVRDQTFGDDACFHLTRTPLKALDQEGYTELLEAHRRLMEETAEIGARAAERMATSGESPVCATSAQQCFEVTGF